MIAMGYSVNPEAETENELPEWRRELSKRLKEIKHKREEPASVSAESALEARAAAIPVEKPKQAKKRSSGRKQKSHEAAGSPPPEPSLTEVLKSAGETGSGPSKKKEPPKAPPKRSGRPPAAGSQPKEAPKEEGENKGSAEIRDLIDSMVAQPDSGEAADVSKPGTPTVLSTHKEDKLIFISRTFAGLVDLLIIVLAASSFIFAVDIIEGIEIFDTVSLLYYFALIIATFFVYSIYFLLTACQTIGMMITDLRVVGRRAKRPTMTQLLTRCGVYLVALLGLGLGLIWGCFDRKNRCLHDRLSHTRVMRILPY
jgi:uncharacterized RDD family membrane protein YckC